MIQETEHLQDQLQNALNELDDAKARIAVLREELGALSSELMQREDCLGVFLKERDTALHALRQLVAEVHNKCPGVALPTLLNARETLLKIS